MKAFGLVPALLALAAATPAMARTPVSVPAFDSVNLQGGGQIIIRHGPQQSVTLIRGDLETTRFTVGRDGRLEIHACVHSCGDYELEVEIVTPELHGVGIEGGGRIRAVGAFPDPDVLALGINGGGEIDVTAIRAGRVAAGIQGGGAILTHARDTLTAGIQGGGAIRYRGDPAVTSGIQGGGAVEPMGSP